MRKKLVLYFSVYGTTKKTAEEIADRVGSDLIEIEPVIPYDSDRNNYNELAALAKKEYEGNKRPVIRNKIDLSGYDTIYIGYPIWWYTFPMILYTLFDEYDFSGKNIIPFNTHLGSSDGGTYRTIRKLQPKASVLDGCPLSMKEAETESFEKISLWLRRFIYR